MKQQRKLVFLNWLALFHLNSKQLQIETNTKWHPPNQRITELNSALFSIPFYQTIRYQISWNSTGNSLFSSITQFSLTQNSTNWNEHWPTSPKSMRYRNQLSSVPNCFTPNNWISECMKSKGNSNLFNWLAQFPLNWQELQIFFFVTELLCITYPKWFISFPNEGEP